MVEILSRDDGHYEFRVFTYVDPDEELRGPAYWSPTQEFGIYEIAERAEQDACNALLRQTTLNSPVVCPDGSPLRVMCIDFGMSASCRLGDNLGNAGCPVLPVEGSGLASK
jgi:hypothetical protein